MVRKGGGGHYLLDGQYHSKSGTLCWFFIFLCRKLRCLSVYVHAMPKILSGIIMFHYKGSFHIYSPHTIIKEFTYITLKILSLSSIVILFIIESYLMQFKDASMNLFMCQVVLCDCLHNRG